MPAAVLRNEQLPSISGALLLLRSPLSCLFHCSVLYFLGAVCYTPPKMKTIKSVLL